MIFKDYPPEIQKRIKEEYERQDRVSFSVDREETSVGGLIIFRKTHEGPEFWSEISKGNFNVFYQRYPRKINQFTYINLNLI